MGLGGDNIPTLGLGASGFPILDTDEMRRRSHASQVEAAGLRV